MIVTGPRTGGAGPSQPPPGETRAGSDTAGTPAAGAGGRFTVDELYERRSGKPLRELPALVRRALRLVWTAGRRSTQVLLGLSVLQSVLTLAQLAIVRRLLLELPAVSNGASVRTIVPEVAGLVGAVTIQGMVGLADAQLRQVLAEEVSRHATQLVARAAASADLLDFERPGFHDRLQRTLVNASSRPLQTAYALIGLASSVLTSAALVVALAVVQPLLLGFLVVAGVPVWMATRRITRLGYEWVVAESQADRRRSYLLMLLTNKEMAKELRSYQLAAEIDTRHGRLWDDKLVRLRALTARRLRLGLLSRLANGVLFGATLAFLLWSVSSGRTSVAEAGAAASAVLLLGQRSSAVLGSTGQLYECALFLRDVDDFLAERAAAERARPKGSLPLPLVELAARRVGFVYPAGRGAPALEAVDVHVRPGEMIALVGVNGSGKTTLAKILAGLLPPTSGAVTWNDASVALVAPEQWRAQVAVVFQDFARYLLDLRENVGFGRVEHTADDARLAAAAAAAGIDDLVDSLPHGWDTLLGPEFLGGSDLSGGQWQRIALARAFFRDAPVVILDEPSSALDPEAEAALFDRMKALGAGRAVVVISHRFSTVTRADRIYVLDSGRVVEAGSHAELMARSGEYARLFLLQAAQYREPES